MIIINNKYGRLGNNLIIFSRIIENSIENNYSVVNTSFNKYAEFFESTCKNDFKPYSISLKLPKKYYVLSRIFRTINYFHKIISRIMNLQININILVPKRFVVILKNDRKFSDLAKEQFCFDAKNKIVFLHLTLGGVMKKIRLQNHNHAEEIKRIFKPCKLYRMNVDRLIRSCRKDCDVLVGVHIRKGDYKKYKNGIYYFKTETYFDKMNQMKRIFDKKKKKVGFLICSDEKINMQRFKDLKVNKANNHIIEDMYSLAECDYIIGPPSTYSGWSSFYGNVPMCIMNSNDQIMNLEEFKANPINI